MPSNINRHFKNLFLPSLFELWLWQINALIDLADNFIVWFYSLSIDISNQEDDFLF